MAVVAMRKNFYNLSKIICPSTAILCNYCRGYMKNNQQTLQHLLKISKKRGDDFRDMFFKKDAEFTELTNKKNTELKDKYAQLEEKHRKLTKIQDMIEIEIEYYKKLESEFNELSCTLKNTETDLEIFTLEYLQETNSMDARSVIEIFEQRYVNIQKGQRIAYWNSFIESNSTVAKIVRRKLENSDINVQNINGNFVSNLYHSLSNEVHKSVKSNSMLYVLKDNLSHDELIFLRTIMDFVIKYFDGEGIISEITMKEWRYINDLDNEKSDQEDT